MYTPKIKENLIPELYRIAKNKKIPMTRLVNNMIEKQIQEGQYNIEESKNQANKSIQKI